jgi:hypothetical protein
MVIFLKRDLSIIFFAQNILRWPLAKLASRRRILCAFELALGGNEQKRDTLIIYRARDEKQAQASFS